MVRIRTQQLRHERRRSIQCAGAALQLIASTRSPWRIDVNFFRVLPSITSVYLAQPSSAPGAKVPLLHLAGRTMARSCTTRIAGTQNRLLFPPFAVRKTEFLAASTGYRAFPRQFATFRSPAEIGTPWKHIVNLLAALNVFGSLCADFHSKAASTMQNHQSAIDPKALQAPSPGEADRIGQLAKSGEQMVERLRRTAFLPGAVKSLNVNVGIAFFETKALENVLSGNLTLDDASKYFALLVTASSGQIRVIVHGREVQRRPPEVRDPPRQ